MQKIGKCPDCLKNHLGDEICINNIAIIIVFVSLLLAACSSTGGFKQKQSELEKFEHNKPLIKEDIKKMGQEEMAKSIEMGPKPSYGEIQRQTKRKKITSEKVRNYLTISDVLRNHATQCPLEPKRGLVFYRFCFLPVNKNMII